MTSGPTIDVMVMRVVTRFQSAAQFITAFRRFCTESTCFIPSTAQREVGIETGFSIRLADGTPMLRGLCVVADAWPAADNPYKRPGVLLGIRSLTAESKDVFRRIQLARFDDAKTTEMPPLFADEPLPYSEERTPGSAFILPANPLTDLTEDALDQFIECMVYEDPLAEAAAAAAAGEHGPTEELPAQHGRDAVATILGVQPLRLTPVFAPAPAPPAEPPPAPKPAAAAAARDERTEYVRVRRSWWRSLAHAFARLRARLRRPARASQPRPLLPSARGPRRPRAQLAPLASSGAPGSTDSME